MNKKDFLSESSYISDIQIKSDPKALLAAYRSSSPEHEDSFLLLLQRDTIGEGDALGREQLIQMLAAASNAEILPQTIVLLDKAVLLACAGNEALGSLCRMEAMGTEILLCRRAAESYACGQELCCGEQAEEPQIWSAILRAERVISL